MSKEPTWVKNVREELQTLKASLIKAQKTVSELSPLVKSLETVISHYDKVEGHIKVEKSAKSENTALIDQEGPQRKMKYSQMSLAEAVLDVLNDDFVGEGLHIKNITKDIYDCDGLDKIQQNKANVRIAVTLSKLNKSGKVTALGGGKYSLAAASEA